MRSNEVQTRVLVAEDEAINRMYIVSLLEAHGFGCITARNGREAVDLFRSPGCEVILMDFGMPVMDGAQAIREIRRIEGDVGGHVPVIVLTAYNGEKDREDSALIGADGFLPKPFSEQELVDAVESVVAGGPNGPADRG